jgi:hypothetical protein
MNNIWPDISCYEERNAYYQSGHALIAVRESLDFARVSIEPQGDVSSWIEVQEPDLSQSRLNSSIKARSDAKSVIRALLGGPAAELRYSFGTYPLDSGAAKFHLANRFMIEQRAVWRAISLAGKISTDSPSLIDSLWRQVNGLIQGDEIWPAIDAVAKSLLIDRELAGCEVCDIVRHAMRIRNP